MMSTWYKEGVLGDLNPGARRAKRQIEKLFQSKSKDLFITSKRDGNHGPGSCHPEGDAFDFLYADRITGEEIRHAVKGLDCDVVFHMSHIHIEYDPKRRYNGN